MYRIYVITNEANGMKYVGKTKKQLHIRLHEHQRYSRRACKQHQPFYRAIREYGEDKFSISLLEETTAEQASEREIFWIQKLGTFGGYNSTKGGSGRFIVNDSLIVGLYHEHHSVKRIHEQTQYDEGTIRKCLKDAGIQLPNGSKRKEIPTRLVEPNGTIHDFPSRHRAAQFIAMRTGISVDTARNHFADVISGNRRTISGYRVCNIHTSISLDP